MNQLVESIINKEHTKANELLEQHLNDIVESKMHEFKKMIAARIDEVTVHPDGMVHTSTGRHILPSVRRLELQLSEGRKKERAVIIKGDIKKTRENIKKAKARIAAKKNKIAPLMPAERKEELRQKTAQMAAKRAERLKNREKREAAEERAKKAENIAKEAGMTTKQAVDVISRQPFTPTPTVGGEYDITVNKSLQPYVAQKKTRPKPVGYNKMSWLQRKLYDLGIKEEALERAKAIVETNAMDKALKDIEALKGKTYKSPMPKAQPPKIDPKEVSKYLHDYAANAKKAAAEKKKK